MSSNPTKFLALRKPCKDCPFVVAVNFPLGIGRRQEIADSLARGETFPCHKTVTYDDDGSVIYNQGESRCFGAASVLYKSGHAAMQMEQIAARLGMGEFPQDEQLDIDDTYNTLEAFVDGDPQCKNLFCIATICDGVHHVDITGTAWEEEPDET